MKFGKGLMLKSLSVLMVAITLSGCAPSAALKPNLVNMSQPDKEASVGDVWIGPFLDERSDQEMGPTYFGTLRGSFGEVISRLHMHNTVSEETSITVGNVLRSVGYRVSPTPTNLNVKYSNGWTLNNGDSKQPQFPLVVGRIKNLYGSFNVWAFPTPTRKVGFEIEICLIDSYSKKTIWCNAISGDDWDKGTIGIRGNSQIDPIMASWVMRIVEDKSKELFTKNSIAQARTEINSAQPASQQTSNTIQAEDRLAKLNSLLERKIITKDEYNAKRSEIIQGL